MKASVLALVFALAAAGCSSLSEKDETVGWSAQRLYGEAKDEMYSRNWEKAIKYLEKLEARYPYGRYAQQAQLDVAYAYWKSGERASAIAAADRFIKLYPNHPNVDYSWYLKGLVNFNENMGLLAVFDNPDMTERDPKGSYAAFESFKEVVTRFPDSKYAVQNYPNAPAIEEAVFIMVKAYDALGMEDLRDAADRVMKKNFPQSKYLTPKGYKRDVPWWKLWDPDW